MKKIVAIGPESTGKSTLCEQLAQHYNTLWCPEFAREYLLEHGMNYSFEDLLVIAKGQIALEEDFETKTKTLRSATPDSRFTIHDSPLFIDTDMWVMKVWCEFVFGKCHRFILDQIIERKYDLYLLCNVDLLWTPDELREYPDLKTRETLYKLYKDIVINQSVPWVYISGNAGQRLEKAIQAVDKLLSG
jgi:NadR type nicotinamide-nucleotide adenylyltransferase